MQEQTPLDRSGANKPLYVWAPSPIQRDAVISLLGFVESETILPLEDMPETVLQDAGTNVLLTWQGAVPHICRAMAAGQMPGAARDEWIDKATALLNVLRSQKKHILSANIMAIEQEPAAARNLLTDLFSYRFRNDAPVLPQEREASSPLLTHIALQTFAKSAPARRAQAELQAFSRINTRASSEPQPPTMDGLFSEVHARSSRANTMQSKLAEITCLNDALAEDLDSTRQAIEASKITRAQEFEELSARFRDEIARLQTDLEVAQSAHDVLRTVHEGTRLQAMEQKRQLEEQLSWSFSEIERYLQTSQAMQAHIHALEADKVRLIDDLKRRQSEAEALGQSAQEYAEHVQALHNSTSWRVTKPLRWIKRKLGSSKHG